MNENILMLGASGLIGQLAVPLLRSYSVYAPARRELSGAHYLKPLPLAYDETAARAQLQAARIRVLDCFVCTLGTTLKDAGSQAAFAAIDRDLVLMYAKLAREFGARQAVLVSSVGADAKVTNFYLRTKGQTEQGLKELGYTRVDLLRPSLLLGKRKQNRPVEAFAMRIATLLGPLMIGQASEYRPVAASSVARALVAVLSQHAPGTFVHKYRDFGKLAER